MENLNQDNSKIYTFPEKDTPEYKELMKSSFNIILKMLFPDFSSIDFKNINEYLKNMNTVKVINLSYNPLPQYETTGAAGMDIRADFSRVSAKNPLKFYEGSGYFDFEKKTLRIDSMARVLIPTGLKIGLPKDMEMQIRPRSGMALKKGLTVINTPGTVDSKIS